MLDRYKKTGGFHQLLILIETSGAKKQEQFLSLIQQESPAWEKELKGKILTIERIFSWPADIMIEVLSRIHSLTLCVVLHGKSQEEIDRVLAPLPMLTKRKLLDQLGELNPNAGEKFSSEMKLIAEVRGIVSAGYIKFEKFAPDLCVAENIEEVLESAGAFLFQEEGPKTKAVHPSTAKAGVVEVHAGKTADAANTTALGEVESLKKKLNILGQENAHLKQENQALKDKLSQIRKIA